MERPDRLVYLSSSMLRGGRADLAGVDWSGGRESRSYSDSKLFVTALAAAVARLCPRARRGPRLGAGPDGRSACQR